MTSSHVSEHRGSALQAEVRGDLGPWDRAMDIEDTPTWKALFGGDGLQTYAVLDGAALPGLPEILITSGLDHDCLFRGAARAELGDSGPWLVALSGQHALTRALLSEGDPPTGLWGRSGFFLRSSAGVDTLVAHLRHFTRVKDAQGKWYFFRFWEPDFVPAYLGAFTLQEQAAFFGNGMINRVIALGHVGHVIPFHPIDQTAQAARQVTLGPAVQAALSQVAEARFRQRTITHTEQKHSLERASVARLYQAIYTLPMRSRDAIEILIDLAASVPDGLLDPRVASALEQSNGAPDLVRAMRVRNALENQG